MSDLTDDEIRALLSLPGRQRISVHTYAWPLAKEVRRLRAELKEAVALLAVSDLDWESQRAHEEVGAYAAYEDRRNAFLAKHKEAT